jgi:chromosomal replication initiator protein
MGQMMANGHAEQPQGNPIGAIWGRASSALKHELGDDTFRSWLGGATLRIGPDGELCLVTPTAIARTWVEKHAWRRISELWSSFDPLHRPLLLRTRTDFDTVSSTESDLRKQAIETIDPVATDAPHIAPIIGGGPPSGGRGGGAGRPSGLQERFTFEAFVGGPSNEFALSVAQRVASWADGHFNPVVFHGPYGFGKTHLLNALAWRAMEAAPEKKVVYLTAERFLSSFVRALNDKTIASFKQDLRSADLLLIDDVHFIGGKQSTEEELFHTLAALMEDGRRVVFSADRPPSAITEIDARLRSHLSAGLVCGIEPADRALRLGILDRKLKVLCRQEGVPGGARPEVLEFIADRFTDSVRELEGALNTLVARTGRGVGALGLDEAQSVLRPHLRGGERRITVDDIQKAASEHFGLRQADMLSERRTKAVARPRQAAMWLAKQLTSRSLPDIGRRFGGRDHTTVLHAVRRIDQLRAEDPQLERDLEALIRKLRG